MNKAQIARFNCAWVPLYEEGYVCELYGPQYDYIFRKWLAAARPRAVGKFILHCSQTPAGLDVDQYGKPLGRKEGGDV